MKLEENMKKIFIGFSGFWSDFDVNDNLITNMLKKHFLVEVIDGTKQKEREKCQYLFYSVFSDEYLKYDCIRIFYTGENLIPDFNLCDYAMGFSEIDFGDRYIRYPIYCWYTAALEQLNHLPVCTEEDMKKKFCAMVVSAPYCQDNYRTDFFHILSKEYKQVDSGGRYLNNIGKPEGVENKLSFLGEYKFSFAFENVSYPGYCTEKILESFAAGTIPIYWGDPEIEKYFNPESFVNCHRYRSMEEVIAKIREIDQDDQKYIRMRNAVAITNDSPYGKIAKDKELEAWLIHICSQELNDAYRRNRFGIGQKYENKAIDMREALRKDEKWILTKVKNKLKKLKQRRS